MDGEIKVSVICPAYNHERYIRKALESILMQKTDFAFEILVGNDCSTDGTKQILDEYAEREIPNLYIFNREKNMGATRNGYDLMKRACGKYTIALETDDYYTDCHKLQIQYDFLENHPQYSGVAHDFLVVDQDGKIICNSGCRRAGGEKFLNSAVTADDFLKHSFFFHTSTNMHINIMQSGENYEQLFLSHPLVGDLTVNSILLDMAPMYMMDCVMSAYREIISEQDGDNARSIARRNPSEACINNSRLYHALTKHFQGRINYSRWIINNLNAYLIGLLKRGKGFRLSGYFYCIKLSGVGIWIQSIPVLIGSWCKARRGKLG